MKGGGLMRGNFPPVQVQPPPQLPEIDPREILKPKTDGLRPSGAIEIIHAMVGAYREVGGGLFMASLLRHRIAGYWDPMMFKAARRRRERFSAP